MPKPEAGGGGLPVFQNRGALSNTGYFGSSKMIPMLLRAQMPADITVEDTKSRAALQALT